jgi:FkbM family methyltransferase
MFRFRKIENCQPQFKKSYSQCGEDLIIKYIFDLRGIERPSYIDIGANDPFFLSNTALFYELGSRGVNIEANPDLFKNFKEQREGDINLNVGVGVEEGELDFYIMSDNTLSTFSYGEYVKMLEFGKTLNRIQRIKVIELQKIIDNYSKGIFPDIMTIDVEGMDFSILELINYEISSPKVVCVEAAEYSPIGAGKRRSELVDFLVSKGYYEYANTNLNAIMVRKDFWFI